MKANKFLGIIVMLVFTICATSAIISCGGSDDNGDNGGNALFSKVLGSWSERDGSYVETFTFNNNGTGTFVSKSSSGTYSATFTYVVTSEYEGTIVVKEVSSSHPSGYDIDTYVFEIVGKKMNVYEIDDDGLDLEWVLYKD